MLSKGQFEEYITYFNNILKTRDELEDKYSLVLDGIYDDVYLIIDMVIDSNLTKEGRNLFWNAYYESNIRDFETLWEIVKNNYNYEPTE
jgi:DNA polymerase elongation subunit (family B)